MLLYKLGLLGAEVKSLETTGGLRMSLNDGGIMHLLLSGNTLKLMCNIDFVEKYSPC